MSQKLKNKLNSCSIIIRKYDLGQKDFFLEKFNFIDSQILENSWEFAAKKIDKKEIIKDASNINLADNKNIEYKICMYSISTRKIYNYLKKDFNDNKLNINEQNIEKRFRNLLALRYIRLEIPKIREVEERRKMSRKEKLNAFFVDNFFLLLFILIFGCITSGFFIDKFTPIKELTERIHERSKYIFNGSICNDGSTSHSQGRGTCSWHGGVNYEFYVGDYAKSIEECKNEAIETSWIDNLFTENPFTEQNWVGEIKKLNSNEVWTTRINCKSENEISLYYPNTGCSGILEKIQKINNKIFFREKLETGSDICTDNGKVIIEIEENTLIFYYCWPNDNIVVAKGILKK